MSVHHEHRKQVSSRTLLLENYFPQALAKLIIQAKYIKPQARSTGWSSTAIDSTGNIWQGDNLKSMKKLQLNQRVQGFGMNSLTFITLEGRLAFLRDDKLQVSGTGIDIVSSNTGGYSGYYVTPIGKLYIPGLGDPIELPEPIVPIGYLLTVSGRIINYDLDNRKILSIGDTASRTSSLANEFTDTIKLRTDQNSYFWYQLKVNNTLYLGYRPINIPKQLGRIADFRTYHPILLMMNNVGKAFTNQTDLEHAEQLPGRLLSINLDDTTIITVTESGQIMYKDKNKPYTTIPRICLL